jgi:hypothetical protein
MLVHWLKKLYWSLLVRWQVYRLVHGLEERDSHASR